MVDKKGERRYTPPIEEARAVLTQVIDIARLPRQDYAREPFRSYVTSKFARAYSDLFYKPENGLMAIDATTMRALATDTYLSDNFSGILDAVSSLRVPDVGIPMFTRGGSYSLFDNSGILRDFAEERVGAVYGTEEKPENAAPFTVSKPLALFMLRALDLQPDISVQRNSDLITAAISKEPGSFHLGGIVVHLPDESGTRQMVMGISSVELTTQALEYLLKTLKHSGAEHSIDPYKDGLFTGAGFLDELAGKTTEAYLNGKTPNELQEIADAEWSRLMQAAIPGPLPGQYC